MKNPKKGKQNPVFEVLGPKKEVSKGKGRKNTILGPKTPMYARAKLPPFFKKCPKTGGFQGVWDFGIFGGF